MRKKGGVILNISHLKNIEKNLGVKKVLKKNKKVLLENKKLLFLHCGTCNILKTVLQINGFSEILIKIYCF